MSQPIQLLRRDDSTWQAKFPTNEHTILFSLPQKRSAEETPDLLQKIEEVFSNFSNINSLSKGIVLHNTTNQKRWKLSIHKESWASTVLKKIVYLIPFQKPFPEKNLIKIDVNNYQNTFFNRTIKKIRSIETHSFSSSTLPTFPQNAFPSKDSFTDMFTQAATWVLQRLEPTFVFAKEHAGSSRLVLSENNTLEIKSTDLSEKSNLTQYIEENRRTVLTYKRFLEREFGKAFVDRTQKMYTFNFEEMIKNASPLLPDHVFSCNIGVNNIELSDANDLLRRVQLLQKTDDTTISHFLSRREHRNLGKIILQDSPEKRLTNKMIKTFLNSHFSKEIPSIRDLDETDVDIIISLLMPSAHELENAFTGRKIRHIEVQGFHTMGDSDKANPRREFFELLHIHKKLKREHDWNSYYELLAHVVAKKSLFRHAPPRVGLIVPAPSDHFNQPRWVFNTAFIDDSQGCVAYVLNPISKTTDRITPIPQILLYRSTAGDDYAINSDDSQAADLNPHGSPGSLKEGLAYKHLKQHIEESSIPLWVLYQEAASKNKRNEKGAVYAKKAVELFLEYIGTHPNHQIHPETVKEQFNQWKIDLEAAPIIQQDNTFETLVKLIEYEYSYQEHPSQKTDGDISFIGHSLGGSLAQYGLYEALKNGRVPLPTRQFQCFSLNGPGIDMKEEEFFINFLREHSAIFENLHIRFDIEHQFEYRDLIAQGGEIHLGSTKKEDDLFPKYAAKVYQPLKTATTSGIIGHKVHGRRFQRAKEEVDYKVTELSPHDLYQHDRSWWMGQKLSKIFGYTLLKSPRISENARRVAGRLTSPFIKLINKHNGPGWGPRTPKGVLALKV